jgi:hypothetical protein
MQIMPLGWKITAACQMANWLAVLLALPWLTRFLGCGRDIGSVRFEVAVCYCGAI